MRSRQLLVATVLSGLLFLIGCKSKQREIRPEPVVKKKKSETTINSGAEVLEQKLGISAKDIKNSKLLSYVKEWYGVPYKYGGCEKKGVDCSCFVSLLYGEVFGRTLSRTADAMFVECNKLSLDEVKEGDLVFFKINGNKISHVGVYLRKNYFAHASTSKGVSINSIEEAYYKKYFFCAGRIKKS